MDKDKKKLLITDLCARLPYAVKINCNGEIGPYTRPSMECTVMYEIAKVDEEYDCWVVNGYDISQVKPYLRTLDDLTDEEKRQYELLTKHYAPNPYPVMEWLNEHHVDYRGLIPKGLALKAKEDMYNTEKKE